MIGDLRDRVVLLRQARTADAGGGFDGAYTSVATVFADVTPRGSRRTAGLSFRRVRRVIRLIIRERDDVTMDDRVSYGEGEYRFTDIRPDSPRRGYLTLVAEEVIV